MINYYVFKLTILTLTYIFEQTKERRPKTAITITSNVNSELSEVQLLTTKMIPSLKKASKKA